MKLPPLRILSLSAATLLSHGAGAVGFSAAPSTRAAPPAAAVDTLGRARALIAAKQWSAALDELRRVNDIGSADWNNLMGYTLRKNPVPDLAVSERHYNEALRIDPHHRNALEYSGELYLMQGSLDKAQARLATLSAECGASCEQYATLSSAIEHYKAAGNKFVATDW
jgi:Flp pilus assembly protein TadD